MKNKPILLILMIVLMSLFFTACRNDQEALARQMAPVLAYTSDGEENVKFVRTKEYDGRVIREFTDSKFFYEVTTDGRLMTIFLRTTPTTTPTVATREEILLKANDNLRRLNYNLDEFQTEVRYNENRKQYESVSRERKGEAFTGNNIYIQYTSDGTLISISFKYENPEILNTEDQITVEEAKEIIMNYFSTNASTEKYAPMLTSAMIRHEVDVYNNKKVFNLYFTLPTEEVGTFDFVYVVSTETGIILYRRELR